MRVATHYFTLHDVMPQKPGSLITIIAKYLLRHEFAIPMNKAPRTSYINVCNHCQCDTQLSKHYTYNYHLRYVSAAFGHHHVVQLMDIIAVWLMDIVFFFFCKTAVCTACESQAYFILLSPRFSVTDIVCIHFHFSVSRPGMGGIQSPISFCLYVVALSVYRASNVWDRMQEQTPCAPIAVRRSISNGDQQLCTKLDDQC